MAKLGYSAMTINLRDEIQDVINKYLSAGIDPATIKLAIDLFSSLLDKLVAERIVSEKKLIEDEQDEVRKPEYGEGEDNVFDKTM